MLTLLQQRAPFNPPPGGGAGAPDALPIVMVLAIYGVAIVVSVGIQIFFLLSLMRCLQQVSEHNRKMSPGQVWLNLIPFFNYVWLILTVLKISDSLKDEYEERGLDHDGDYGKTLGLIFYISLFVCPCATIVLLIMYWLKISGFTSELMNSGGKRRRRSERRSDDEYED